MNRSRLLKTALLKQAADLGMQNIPQMFVQGATGYNLQALYWREGTNDNKTVEIWKTSDGVFIVAEGDYTDGEWGQQDVSIVNEAQDIRSALSYAETNYSLLQDEPPIDESQEGTLAASTKFTRLKKQA